MPGGSICIPPVVANQNIQVLPMNLSLLNRAALALISVTALASCGGGSDDNEAGAPQAFNVQPSTMGVKNAAGSCASGLLGEVFIYGGAAPYYINNTFPGAITVSKTRVEEAGGSFTVTLNGVCVDPALLVVVDKLNKQVTVSISSPFVEATTP
jgi:hypothetical protein